METQRLVRKTQIGCLGAAVLVVLLSAQPAAAAITLPAPNPPVNSLTYGDFYVYSLPFLQYYLFGDITFNSGDYYYVDTSPGAIHNDLVIATGSGGQGGTGEAPDNQDVAPGIADDAYETTTGVAVLHYTFATSTSAPDPVPTFQGDVDYSWDVATSAVRDVLDGSNLVFWFNLNETGGSGLGGQDLYAWAEVTLVDLDEDGHVQDEESFYLTGEGSPMGNQILDGRNDWAWVHGVITVKDGQFVHLGPMTNAEKKAGAEEIVQNLGAQKAAFAVYSPELDQLLDDEDYDVLRVKVELGYIDDGYEQALIRGADIGNVIPEAASIVIWSLLGVGGLGVTVRARRRARAQS